jgi:hypothetical protein
MPFAPSGGTIIEEWWRLSIIHLSKHAILAICLLLALKKHPGAQRSWALGIDPLLNRQSEQLSYESTVGKETGAL